jgi:hypothetical protein
MRRRQLLAAIATSVAAPAAAERQRAVGVLMNYADSDPAGQARIGAFRQGLDGRKAPSSRSPYDGRARVTP